MTSGLTYGILSLLPLIFFIGVIALIVMVVRMFRHKKSSLPVMEQKDWYLHFTLSREDALRQVFYLVSFFFFSLTLLALNRDLGEPINSKGLALIISIVALTLTYFCKSLFTLPLGLIGLVGWWMSEMIPLIDKAKIQPISVLAGVSLIALIFYVIGHLHEIKPKYKRLSLVYLIIGIISITFTLLFMSSKEGLRVLQSLSQGHSFVLSGWMTLSLMVLAASLAGGLFFAYRYKLVSYYEALAVIVLAMILGGLVLLPPQQTFIQSRSYLFYSSGNDLTGGGLLWAIIFNLAIFFESLGVILSGYQRREEWLINLGALFLFLLVFVKYFDWFFSFLDKSLFFIGAGILLFGVGWLMERGRRMMISNIKEEEVVTGVGV